MAKECNLAIHPVKVPYSFRPQLPLGLTVGVYPKIVYCQAVRIIAEL
jgi:hypothetical protein